MMRPAQSAFFEAGEVRIALLSLLKDGPKHGYAMTQDIAAVSGQKLGPGTLYGAIARLETRKWIEPLPADDRRRPYKLTGAGQDRKSVV